MGVDVDYDGTVSPHMLCATFHGPEALVLPTNSFIHHYGIQSASVVPAVSHQKRAKPKARDILWLTASQIAVSAA